MKNLAIFLGFILLTSCSSNQMSTKENKIKNIQIFTLNNPPIIGKTYSNQNIYIGGFQALNFIEKKSNEYYFSTITDRGPIGEQVKMDTPFINPEFTPSVITLKTNEKNEIEIINELKLKKKNGKLLTGLPNSRSEENPVDIFGFPYSIDPEGINSGALTTDDENSYWVGDKYSPSILKFNNEGKLKNRLMPVFELPRSYGERLTNKGFNGLTKIQNKLYGMLQSPLPMDKNFSRIVEFDLDSFKTTNEYFYQLEKNSNYLGSSVALDDGSMLVIEQNGKMGKESIKKIFRIKLLKTDDFVEKVLIVDLNETPLKDEENIQGLALIKKNQIAVALNNNYGINNQIDFKTGLTTSNEKKTKIYLLDLENNL